MLHGEKGLFKYIEEVLQARGHAVICIAEGAGQARTFSSSRCAHALCCLRSFVPVWCSWKTLKCRRHGHAADCPNTLEPTLFVLELRLEVAPPGNHAVMAGSARDLNSRYL